MSKNGQIDVDVEGYDRPDTSQESFRYGWCRIITIKIALASIEMMGLFKKVKVVGLMNTVKIQTRSLKNTDFEQTWR